MSLSHAIRTADAVPFPPTIDAGAAKAALRRLGGGVSVITAGVEGERTGATVTSATALSMDPPTMIVLINKASSTWPVIDRHRHFCVNVLDASHKDIADRFAGIGGVKGEARYDHASWSQGASGAPVLDDALASLDCIVEEVVERHSHAIILGRIVGVKTADGASLVYGNGRYGRIGDL